MNIVIYSDKNFEIQANNFIKSIKYAGIFDYKILYYNIGFTSSIQDENVLKVFWKNDGRRPEFYKPDICLDVLKYCSEEIYYFDCDIILSKRFLKLEVKFGNSHPMYSQGPIEYPYTWESENGNVTNFSEGKLMDYLGVKERTMSYVMACFFTYDKNCRDFLEEYSSFCNNKYLLKDAKSFYPFTDETVANVLLWKRGISNSYGKIFVNTHKYKTFLYCETSDNIMDEMIDDNPYEFCENSSRIFFYHGTKVANENEKILKYINENS